MGLLLLLVPTTTTTSSIATATTGAAVRRRSRRRRCRCFGQLFRARGRSHEANGARSAVPGTPRLGSKVG